MGYQRPNVIPTDVPENPTDIFRLSSTFANSPRISLASKTEDRFFPVSKVFWQGKYVNINCYNHDDERLRENIPKTLTTSALAPTAAPHPHPWNENSSIFCLV